MENEIKKSKDESSTGCITEVAVFSVLIILIGIYFMGKIRWYCYEKPKESSIVR